MQAPPTPIDETQRLRFLRTLCILDTVSEERFDCITRLACRASSLGLGRLGFSRRKKLN